MNADKNANVSFGFIKGTEFTFNHEGNIIKLIQFFTGKDRVTVNGRNVLAKRSFKVNESYLFDIDEDKYEITLDIKFGKGSKCSLRKSGKLIKGYLLTGKKRKLAENLSDFLGVCFHRDIRRGHNTVGSLIVDSSFIYMPGYCNNSFIGNRY
jgi:hypothetical protein